MSTHHDYTKDLIGLGDIAKQIPHIALKAPKMLKGLLISNPRNPKKNVGLGWAFAKAVAKNPNGDALLFEDLRFSYRELDVWSNQVANYLISKGVKKGDVIAVYMENRPELICFCLAMAKIGAVAAMVNTSQTGKVLTHSINLVKASHVVVGEELAPCLDEVLDDIKASKDNLYWWADANTLSDTGDAPAGYKNLALEIKGSSSKVPSTAKDVHKDDGLFYIYTSGTTGLPKAVVFTHGRWTKAYGTFGHIVDLNANDVMYVTLPLYHATGIVVCWVPVLRGAGALALRRKFSASNFWKDVKRFDASAFGYVGELCRYLLDVEPNNRERTHRVRKMLGNGLRPNIWHEFKDRFCIDEVFEFYASSEGNIGFSNVFNFENTVGFSPLPYKLVQYDKEQNEPVRDSHGHCIEVGKGEVGLLVGEITPKSPFDGYTDPEKNKAVILRNVFKKGDKYFNTGDLMRDIGFKHTQFVDRIGDTFRWKGENVSTTEVENIMSDHDDIHEAIVYGVEIQGTNGRAGMAAITPNEGEKLDVEKCTALLPYLQEELPPYAVPVFLRIQDHVEQTGTFKYSKSKLKEVAFNPEKTDEPILVCLPNDDKFTLVDKVLFNKIQSGEFRF